MAKSNLAKDYQAIRIGSLAGDEPTTFDTFLKVGDRYVLYCRNGQIFDGDRLFRLKEKNIATLHIRATEQIQYNLYLQRNIEKAYSQDQNIPIDIRTSIVISYNCDLIEQMFEALDDQDLYRQIKDSSTKYVDFICNQSQAFESVMKIPNSDASISLHGARVGALAISLAEKLKLIDNNRPIHLLAFGCFIHDLEHIHSGFDYRRELKSLSKEDLKMYKKHPMDGAARLQEIKFFDPLVRQIVLQHEELMDGSGFPKGLKEDDMDPLMLVAGIANSYDRLVSFENKNPKEALKFLLIDKMGAYPLPFLQGLQGLLKERGLVTE
jgi:HD-GYP domain-containing protein (c-di-GMP phosphodiesterase class II)